MAEIKVAKSAGFCFGVDRAVKLVYGELEKGNKSVATLGPIIHNADVVNDLTDKGVRIADSVDDLKEGEKAVIRSHGVGKKSTKDLNKRAMRILTLHVHLLHESIKLSVKKPKRDTLY